MAASKASPERIELPQLKKVYIKVVLVGDTPLLCNRFSEKAKKEMLDKQMKKATTTPKEAKDPVAQYEGSLYKLPDGSFGFPTIAFKAAAVTAANDGGIHKTLARRAFHIEGEFARIEYLPRMREDVVRVGPSRVADLRYRGEFETWKTTLNVVYNAGIITPEQLVNLFQLAGFGVGVGEWRPEKDGVHGMFHVAMESEL
jgi:hypothetical protein